MTTPAELLRRARAAAGLSQRQLAKRAGTSQSVVQRVESGKVDPSVNTLRRLIQAAGADLRLELLEPFSARPTARARPLSPSFVEESSQARPQAIVTLPHHVRWSGPRIQYDLANRQDRARVYEQVLREGTTADLRNWVDIDDLANVWDDLYLPPDVRQEWEPVVRQQREAAIHSPAS